MNAVRQCLSSIVQRICNSLRQCPDALVGPRASKLPRCQNQKVSRKEKNLLDLRLSEYYFENGFRKVHPYWFTWTATVKGRWIGRTVLEVYNAEFTRSSLGNDAEHLIRCGRILVNHRSVSPDYKLCNNDFLSHRSHRHEAHVLDTPIKFCQETKSFLAIDKPASIPVHPCGRYNLNSITSILHKQYRYRNLRLVHRLDRATSGVLIFAKTEQAAKVAEHMISSRKVCKSYICQVDGSLPSEQITVKQPIKVLSYKHGICRTGRKGELDAKQASTTFERVPGHDNLVYCYPDTGRMHQIRVHLQYLGVPIVNDNVYNDKSVWGDKNGFEGDYGGLSDSDIRDNFAQAHWIGQHIPANAGLSPALQSTSSDHALTPNSLNGDTINDNITNKKNPEGIDKIPSCPVNKLGKNNTINPPHPSIHDTDYCFDCTCKFDDPDPKTMVLNLHAFKYDFLELDGQPNVVFQTEMPKWAV